MINDQLESRISSIPMTVVFFQDSYYNETVQSANGVFRQSGVGVSSYYERALEEFYKTRMDALDFAGDEAGARDFINEWVSSHTDHRIQQLLAKPLAADTQLVLVNALAMKARWLFSFDEAHTFAKGLFYINSQRRSEYLLIFHLNIKKHFN